MHDISVNIKSIINLKTVLNWALKVESNGISFVYIMIYENIEISQRPHKHTVSYNNNATLGPKIFCGGCMFYKNLS
jgi:hypothetical protein